VASNRQSDNGVGRSGRFRSLIPFFRRRPQAGPVAPSSVPTASLAVRPPWWRMAVQRMVGGLWPGFRTGRAAGRPGSPSRLGDQAGSPKRPLVAQRTPLASKASVLPVRKQARQPLTSARPFSTPRDTMIGGLAPQLTMAPPPGWGLPAQQDSAELEAGQPSPAALAAQASQAASVALQREAARVSLASPPARSLAAPPTLTGTRPTETRHSNARYTDARPASDLRVQRTAAAQSLAAESLTAPQPMTPEQRWREAVAQVPLETPRPFPTSMRPLVAQLAGKTSGVGYTTGAATRRALNEVGAFGATTGSVVHLAQAPSSGPAQLGVLAHELTHARTPIARPRFMLHNHVGHMDSDERQARSVGEQFTNPVAASLATPNAGRPGIAVQRSLIGGLTDRVTDAVGSAGSQATGMVGGLANQATSAIDSGASSLTSQAGSAVSGLSDRFTSAASDLGNEAANQAGTVTAGLVDQLPVGGGAAGALGGLSQIARTMVESAVRDATSSTVSQANDAVSQMSQTAQGMASQLQGMATDGVNSAAGQANQWVNGAVSQASGAVQGVGDQVGAAVSDAENAAAGGINSALNKAGSALGAGPGATPQISGQDLDRIAEALEERLLRQLERRGGRYAGVF
jgi:hypothetical protein